MSSFACSTLALDTISPPPLNLKRLYEAETVPSEAVLFITTPGADPSQELRDLAANLIGLDKYTNIAMGQGQAESAMLKLKEAAQNGHWLCLQNVHLAAAWLPNVEKELKTTELHKDFRLWLTSEAHAKFPVTLLQNSLKITIEAPPGVKKNIQRIYESWTPDFIERGSVVRSQALFALAWYHAIIQERRTYIPQGWNKFYEYSSADLRSSAEVLDKMLKSSKSPSWIVLRGLLQNAIYGGRIDDRQDDLKLHTYLEMFFNDDVFAIGGRNPVKKLSRSIILPNSVNHQDYVKIIQEIPDADQPSLFGLPENIDRTLQKTTSQQLISQLKSFRQIHIVGKKVDRDILTRDLGPFLQLWKKLTTGNDILNRKLIPTTDTDPLASFLALELTFALHLVKIINLDLSFASKITRGVVSLNNEISAVVGSIMKGETPDRYVTLLPQLCM